jgi:hypothetical protein
LCSQSTITKAQTSTRRSGVHFLQRAEGVGGALTAVLRFVEDAVHELLEVPSSRVGG